MWCNNSVQMILNSYCSYRLYKPIKLLDEDAISVEELSNYLVCSHGSNTSGILKFSTSLYALYSHLHGVVTIAIFNKLHSSSY